MTKVTEPKAKQSLLGMIVSILIVVVSFVFFYLNPLGLSTTLYKVLFLLTGFLLSGFVFFKSPQGVRFSSFLIETKIELRKVVWPTRDETIKTTGMIMVAVVIVAIFLWIIDALFSWMVHLLTN
ncbi:preprotein translocase subunit SecE [Candidatus Vesicomyidisocius calyptogenae]|uniref:Protein translocase subunit SecE n=1 Tax=Vesicomyosocius okutanii subsp. Calyptogena okutanii (strain HA) TaxID=412965 RepID=A5CW31_VESOH|nr:preprotein translocase subunit SecE [Candidatus Vesicomyosocius okutanii]BAF61854.1 preprotein translocase SecE subunit [Candidatus Vesicomyosocius okutanii]